MAALQFPADKCAGLSSYSEDYLGFNYLPCATCDALLHRMCLLRSDAGH